MNRSNSRADQSCSGLIDSMSPIAKTYSRHPRAGNRWACALVFDEGFFAFGLD